MTGDTTNIDLEVSGPQARHVASSVLSETGDAEADSVDVTLDFGGTEVSVSGDGVDAETLVGQMVSGIDWDSYEPTAVSVQTSVTPQPDTDFDPPEDPEYGDRVGPWLSPEGDIVRSVPDDTVVSEVLEVLQDEQPALVAQIAERIEITDKSTVGSTLSKLFTERGLVERARAHRPTGGMLFLYRLNGHGEAVLEG